MTTSLAQWARPRATVFALLLLAISVACGGKDLQPTEPDPPWVAEYQSVAREGCKCTSEACLNKARTRLDSLVSDHGGFDEVPLSIHEAHEVFDPCWRSGTADLARDLSKRADAICRCEEFACVQSYRENMVALEDKYGTNFEPPLDQKLTADAQKELARATACLGELSVPGEEYLASMETTTLAICECKDIGCMQKILGERKAQFTGRVFVDSLSSIQSKLDISNARYCDCLGEALAHDVANSLAGGMPKELNVKVDCP